MLRRGTQGISRKLQITREREKWQKTSRQHLRLCEPIPESLKHILRSLIGPFFSVERGLAGSDVCVSGADPPCVLNDLPEDEESEVDAIRELVLCRVV